MEGPVRSKYGNTAYFIAFSRLINGVFCRFELRIVKSNWAWGTNEFHVYRVNYSIVIVLKSRVGCLRKTFA